MSLLCYFWEFRCNANQEDEFTCDFCLTGFIFFANTEIANRQLKGSDDFVWAIEVPLTGKFIIDVEFLDLKTASPDVRFY